LISASRRPGFSPSFPRIRRPRRVMGSGRPPRLAVRL
jgi:hypothetical protein